MTSVNRCLLLVVLNIHHRDGVSSGVSKEITWKTVFACFEDQRVDRI